MLKLGKYERYKGKLYEVVGVAHHSETVGMATKNIFRNCLTLISSSHLFLPLFSLNSQEFQKQFLSL